MASTSQTVQESSHLCGGHKSFYKWETDSYWLLTGQSPFRYLLWTPIKVYNKVVFPIDRLLAGLPFFREPCEVKEGVVRGGEAGHSVSFQVSSRGSLYCLSSLRTAMASASSYRNPIHPLRSSLGVLHPTTPPLLSYLSSTGRAQL